MIDMLRSKHLIGLLCRVAHVFPSGYYAWRKNAPKRKKKDEEDHILADTIQTSCGKKLGKEGYRQVSMRFKGTHNHKKIARVMKQHGLQAKIRRADPYKKIPRDGGEHSIAPNILKRAFDHTILWPHRVFGTDITYLRVADGRGWAYLSAVKDLCSGEIVAHALSMHPDTDLVLATLDRFACAISLEDRLGGIMHSDQGCTYTAQRYQERVRQCGLQVSMSRRGNCIDNASMESFFGHFKDDLPQTRQMHFQELQECVDSHIMQYNMERKQWDRKKMTPVEYRDHLLSS